MTDLIEMDDQAAEAVAGGAVAPLIGLALVVLVPLAIDLGHISLTKTSVQNAAADAALAGVRKLLG